MRSNRQKFQVLRLLLLVLFLATATLVRAEEKAIDCTGDRSKLAKEKLEYCLLGTQLQDDVSKTFTEARNEYVKGHYDNCLRKLDIVHSFIQEYKNSREIQGFCEKGKVLFESAAK